MKTACLVITLALMVMTVASSPSWPLRRSRKVYEDPNPCDQACYDGCCEGECTAGSETEDICSSECGCRKRTLQGLMAKRRRTFFEDPNPCDQACYDGCCEGECTAGSETEDICSSECGCRKRTLQGLMAKRRRTFFEDPNPCDQGCHDECCTTDSGEYECTAGSNQKDICDQECGCRKRTLQALKAKRGDEEYPTDAAYQHVSAAECAACKKSECPAGVSDVVCNEICAC